MATAAATAASSVNGSPSAATAARSSPDSKATTHHSARGNNESNFMIDLQINNVETRQGIDAISGVQPIKAAGRSGRDGRSKFEFERHGRGCCQFEVREWRLPNGWQ
jgi:hypothetical protein